MKIVFFGTPETAADVLEALIAAKHEIVGVATPDRPKGRGQQLAVSPVKELAAKHKLLITQPDKIKNDPEFKKWLQGLKADVAVVVAYGQIFSGELLAIPKFGFINLHASLLPKYRGAAPVQWALLNGEKMTGVTIMKLDPRLDAGDLILQRSVPIADEDDAISLMKKVIAAGKESLLEALKEIGRGQATFTPQCEGDATFAPSLTKESGEIDWRKPAVEIHNRVRALVPWPTAHTYYKNNLLKIWRAAVLPGPGGQPGEIVEIVKKSGPVVATGQGNLLLLEVQIAGKKRVLASDFLIGHDVKKGDQIPS